MLLQNRRRFLVQMTINLGQNQNFDLSAVKEVETTEEENKKEINDENEINNLEQLMKNSTIYRKINIFLIIKKMSENDLDKQ